MATKSDHALVAEIQAGRRNALGELFDRHSPALYDFIYRVVGDRDQTARLLEEVFERTPGALGTLDNQTPVRGWLFGLARDIALTFLRQKGWLDALPPSDEPSVSGLVGDIWRAARGMPAFHRVVLAVEELHGLSPTEKARSLSVARTDLVRLIEDARRSFDNQFDLQARQQGRPLSTQIDPERIWGVNRRIGTSGTLFGYLPVVVLPDSLASMVRGRVIKSARMSAGSDAEPIQSEPPRPEPVVIPEPPVERPAPPIRERRPEPEPTPTPRVEKSSPVNNSSVEDEAMDLPEEGSGGCAWRLVGIALVIALVVTALAVGIGYLLTRDSTGPTITKFEPAENATVPLILASPTDTTTNVRISATYKDDRGIDIKSVRLVLDGRDVAPQAIVNDSSVTFKADLDPGVHVVLVEVKDTSGNMTRRSWQFSVTPPPEPTLAPTSTPTLTPLPTTTRTATPTNTATPIALPNILDFSATRTVITRGTPILITWNVQGADQIFFNQEKVEAQGSRLVTPSATTVYHLIANNSAGPIDKTLTITIQELPDLIVTDISLTPANQIIFTVQNVGTAGVTKPFLIQVTANSVAVESDKPIAALPAGQQAILVVPNYTVLGTVQVTVALNVLQEVQEIDYTNNFLTKPLIGPTPTTTATPTNTSTPIPTYTSTPTFTPVPTNTPTNTPTLTNTPTRTRTPTPSPIPFAVTNLTASVNPTTYTGACPPPNGTFVFSGLITTNGSGNVTYRWEKSTGIPSSSTTIAVPSAGTYPVTDTWSGSVPTSGWETLHVTSPDDIQTIQITFTNSCH